VTDTASMMKSCFLFFFFCLFDPRIYAAAEPVRGLLFVILVVLTNDGVLGMYSVDVRRWKFTSVCSRVLLVS
jgi:hypothetical protein